jgi:hypothetical protein
MRDHHARRWQEAGRSRSKCRRRRGISLPGLNELSAGSALELTWTNSATGCEPSAACSAIPFIRRSCCPSGRDRHRGEKLMLEYVVRKQSHDTPHSYSGYPIAAR